MSRGRCEKLVGRSGGRQAPAAVLVETLLIEQSIGRLIFKHSEGGYTILKTENNGETMVNADYTITINVYTHSA